MKDWILSAATAAFIGGIAVTLAPEGKMRRAVSLVCGFMTIAVMLSPVRKFSLDDYSVYLNEFKIESGEYSGSLTVGNEQELKIVIESKTAAYIQDKTGVTAEVTARKVDNSDYPVPWEVRLYSEYDESAGRLIESELGIPTERQKWRQSRED
jgi:hypothetical protein